MISHTAINPVNSLGSNLEFTFLISPPDILIQHEASTLKIYTMLVCVGLAQACPQIVQNRATILTCYDLIDLSMTPQHFHTIPTSCAILRQLYAHHKTLYMNLAYSYTLNKQGTLLCSLQSYT